MWTLNQEKGRARIISDWSHTRFVTVKIKLSFGKERLVKRNRKRKINSTHVKGKIGESYRKPLKVKFKI